MVNDESCNASDEEELAKQGLEHTEEINADRKLSVEKQKLTDDFDNLYELDSCHDTKPHNTNNENKTCCFHKTGRSVNGQRVASVIVL